MKYLFITTLFSLFFLGQLEAQTWGANTFGQFTNEAVDVETDATGNYFVIGYLTGETAFNSSNVVPSAAGNGDIYVAKYAANGTFVWVKTFGGNFSDRGTDLALSPDGGIVITGQFFGNVNFGSTTLTSVSNSKDIFLAKLDNSGAAIWARSEGGNLAENAYGVTVDHQNNVILTGQFQGQAQIGSSTFTSAIDPNTGQSSFDFFVSKYDQNGTPIWQKNGFAEYEDRGLAVAVDGSDNIFFTGQFSKDLQFAGQTYLNLGYNIGFLCKLSPSGNVQFFNQLKAGMVIPYDLEVNSDNQVFVVGDFLGNMNYYDASGIHSVQNPYSKQIFVLKTANSGSYTWNYTLGSEDNISARAVSIDLHKDVFVTGYFECGLGQLHDSMPATFNSVGYKDVYLMKVNNDGDREYIKHFGGKMDDEGQGVALPQNDEPTICGSFTKDLNFAPSVTPVASGTSNYVLNATASVVDPFHYYLKGDSTRNSFLVTNVNASYEALNYYIPQVADSAIGYILPNSDTIHFCTSEIIQYETLTGRHYGPSYSFLWSNGSVHDTAHIFSTANYWVNVHRSDQCAFDVDSVFAISEPIPQLPLLTDNLGIHVNAIGPNYGGYHFCAPDSVEITYSNIEPGTTITTVWPNGIQQVQGVGPLLVYTEGLYEVRATNQYCENSGHFYFNLDYVEPYDSIHLGIVMQTGNPTNDSITVCSGSDVVFGGTDFMVNPDSNFVCLEQPWVVADWAINGMSYYNDNSEYVRTHFIPGATDWYTVDLWLTRGYDNLCGIDTTMYHVTRQFYIHVNPNPTWSGAISGDNLLCPNGSVFLVVNNPHAGFTWSGPGIIWNNGNDSIEVNTSGTHHYHGTVIDSLTGCGSAFDISHTIVLKQGPNISSDPADAIICPYDSVQMMLPNQYLSYEWIGPNGNLLSTTNTCYGEDLGFYYCNVVDDENCSLTTPPFELREYTTPSITVVPDEFLCNGESVDLIVTYTGDASFVWSPINSTADEITVTQPGVYTVSITQCGITVADTIEIIDGTFTASISVSDTMLCFGEEAVITGIPADGMYQWTDGQQTGGSYTVGDTGVYSAIVMNQYGCTAQTNSVMVHAVPGSYPPVIADAYVCRGSDLLLEDNSGFPLNWYTEDTTFLFTGPQNLVTNIQSDTVFLVAYTVNECEPAYSHIQIDLYDTLGVYEILGDSLLCQGEDGVFSVDLVTETVTWIVGGISYGTANPVTVPYNVLVNNPVVYATISTPCESVTIVDSIFFVTPSSVTLADDSLMVCAYSETTVGIEEDLEAVQWSWSGGNFFGDELTVNGSEQYGTIAVTGTGENGCAADTAYLVVTTSSLQFDITVDFENYCYGDSGSIEVASNTDSLMWNTPLGSFDTTVISLSTDSLSSGWYSVTLWDAIGCEYSDSVFVPVYEYVPLDILPDSIFCINDVLTFYFPNDTNTYFWTTYGNSTDIPILFDQELILNVVSPQGCLSTDTLVVHTVDCEGLLPNFFTPNGDGDNDVFIIDDAYAQAHNTLIIINRYGNPVFEASPYKNDFGGDRLQEGVYFYLYYPEGEDHPETVREGFVHLIR